MDVAYLEMIGKTKANFEQFIADAQKRIDMEYAAKQEERRISLPARAREVLDEKHIDAFEQVVATRISHTLVCRECQLNI